MTLRRCLFAHRFALAAAFAGLTACGPNQAPPSTDAATNNDAPEQLALGQLRLRACSLDAPLGSEAIAAQCTRFAVPEDRSKPGGRKIDLRIAWLPPRDQADSMPDPVVFIAGGPGQSAVDSYPQVAQALRDINKQRGILLVDQRGTGQSNPLLCDTRQTENLPAEGYTAFARDCARTLSAKADLTRYTTTDAVADLDAVRQAIGAAQINLFGVSYGTRVAQQYAMRHPQATRSIVLDSPVPNSVGLGNIFAHNLQQALTAQFALCKRDAACRDKLGDPLAEADSLMTRLRQAPQDVTFRDPRTAQQQQTTLRAEDVAGLIRMYAYAPMVGALLPQLIHEANQGRYQNLAALSHMLKAQMHDALAMGMQLSVVCSEDRHSLVARPEDAGSLLGSSVTDLMARMCAAWPSAPVPADFSQPLRSAVPALILAGEFDPVTPPAYGKDIVTHLRNGRLLVLNGQGHNVIGAGCMPKLFAQFVETADARALDVRCLDTLPYTPPFTSFNGWEP